MKKAIVLEVEWFDAKKFKKSEEEAKHQEVFNDAVKLFKEQLKTFFDTKTVKILKENLEYKEVSIEFPEVIWEKLNKELIAASVVTIIDSFSYKDEK